MQTVLPYTLMIIGFVLLVKGADILVSGAVALARRLNISDLVIGMTIVAFGTSSPELFVNILASFKGSSDIAVGNILGSNIANILLILGVSALIYPLSVSKGTVWREIPFSLLAALALGVLANDFMLDGLSPSVLSRSDGLVLLMFLAIFLYYSASIAHSTPSNESRARATSNQGIPKASLMVVAGLAGLVLGGKWIVDGAVHIAREMGMSEALVGLTIVAIGTSLPELATSAMAAYRRNLEIAVGNVVGSNIFNIFLVLGTSSVLKPLPFQSANNLDIGVVIAASLILFFTMFTGKHQKLDRWEGALLLVFYCAYLIYLVIRG